MVANAQKRSLTITTPFGLAMPPSFGSADAEYVDGTEKGGIKTFGLKEGGIDYAQNQYNKELLGDIPTTLDELKQKIIDGEIKVPTKPT